MKTIRLKLIAALILTIGWQAETRANIDDGLVMTGTVTSISERCIEGTPTAAIGVYFQIRNDSDEAILFLTPYFLFEARLFDLTGDFSSARFTQKGSARTFFELKDVNGKSIFDSDNEEQEMRKRWANDSITVLQKTIEPNGKNIHVIGAGRYYEFRDEIFVVFDEIAADKNSIEEQEKPKGECDGTTSPQAKELSIKDLGLGNVTFKVEYRLSLKKYKDADDVLEKLRDRLKPFGRLPLNSAGEIVYRTEDIILVQ